MGRPSTYQWGTFRKNEARSWKKKPTRSAVASMITLSRDWCKRHGKNWAFKVSAPDRRSITVVRVK